MRTYEQILYKKIVSVNDESSQKWIEAKKIARLKSKTGKILKNYNFFQNTDSALRDKCTGWLGLRSKRLRGNFSNVFKSWLKSGRSDDLNDQHCIKISCEQKKSFEILQTVKKIKGHFNFFRNR